jgi:hypothetical protein
MKYIIIIVIQKDKVSKGFCIRQYTFGRMQGEPPPQFANRGGGTPLRPTFFRVFLRFQRLITDLEQGTLPSYCYSTKVGGYLDRTLT